MRLAITLHKDSGATQACKHLVDVFDRHDFKQNLLAPGLDILGGHFRDGPTQRMSGLHDRLDGPADRWPNVA
jgi:hypothetical protein